MWPNARISVMGGEQWPRCRDGAPRRHGRRGQGVEQGGRGSLQAADPRPVRDAGHPYYATARLWDDGVIDLAQTRRVLGLALSASLNAPVEKMRFGVFRM
ncbi:MAG: carboxyl transferase domain-containing protein [Burkholderiales bacterium]